VGVLKLVEFVLASLTNTVTKKKEGSRADRKKGEEELKRR